MKKVMNFLLGLVIILSLFGCSNKNIETYTITLELDGGIGDSSIVEDFGTIISEPTPTKEGYIFGGWYTSVEYTTEYVFDTMESEDITLYAQWNTGDFNITLSANIGEATPVLVTYSCNAVRFTSEGMPVPNLAIPCLFSVRL